MAIMNIQRIDGHTVVLETRPYRLGHFLDCIDEDVASVHLRKTAFGIDHLMGEGGFVQRGRRFHPEFAHVASVAESMGGEHTPVVFIAGLQDHGAPSVSE